MDISIQIGFGQLIENVEQEPGKIQIWVSIFEVIETYIT